MLSLNSFVFRGFLVIVAMHYCGASRGDRFVGFQDCYTSCHNQHCTRDGRNFQRQSVEYSKQSIFNKLLFWRCADECKYDCMWQVIENYPELQRKPEQFFGKWPFIRFMGCQEPASVLFSILNFVQNFRGLRKFRREVRPDSPCYRLWHIFGYVCLNGWIWSSFYHARDFPLTETLDYVFANSMNLVILYCLVMRLLFNWSLFLRGYISAIFLLYFISICAYYAYDFSYTLNLYVNTAIAVATFLGWILWCFMTYKRRPYCKELLRFYIGMGLAISFELHDFFPIFWTFDAHSVYHFCTIFLVPLMYSFAINDCKALRNEEVLKYRKLNKQT